MTAVVGLPEQAQIQSVCQLKILILVANESNRHSMDIISRYFLAVLRTT